MKNIVIVGGGTAGWLTALYAKKVYKNENIILIESEEYGIVGAGEGTTPNFMDFLVFLDISVYDLMQKCNGTIKNGIKFTNWSNKGGSYFHPFYSTSSASNDYNFNLKSNYLENYTEFSHYSAFFKKHKLKDYSFLEKTSNNFKIPFILNNETQELTKFAEVAMHFNATLLANYLKNIGQSRGIILKEGIVDKITNDSKGYISKLKVNKEEIDCDFVFDCTGFRRIIIGNHYKVNWKSHSKHLPAKKAMPFFLKMDKEIPPYTEAIAMDYGWMWKIPLQDRYGCGYVFDSNYISDEEAIKEIEKFLGFKPQYPREKPFDFFAGCYEKIWTKNCLAVGLASGFIEPLEATSIMQTIFVLKRFMSNAQNLEIKNDFVKEKFNKIFLEETNEIVNFLYLHYVTNKKNTVFWKNFIKNNLMPEEVNYILNICKEKVLINNFDLPKNAIFSSLSHHYILIGNKIISNKDIGKNAKFIIDEEKIKNYEYILKEQEKIIPQLLTHNNFIDIIKKHEEVKNF